MLVLWVADAVHLAGHGDGGGTLKRGLGCDVVGDFPARPNFQTVALIGEGGAVVGCARSSEDAQFVREGVGELLGLLPDRKLDVELAVDPEALGLAVLLLQTAMRPSRTIWPSTTGKSSSLGPVFSSPLWVRW